jgi:hypothetical protein
VRANYVQLRAALDGSFEYEIAAARGNVINAMGLAMEELADELVGKLRYDFQSSGLKNAQRLSGAAWRRNLYGVGKSLEPAAWVFSKLPLIVQAFENGQTIRARSGKGLLIPNPDVWPAGRVKAGRGRLTGGSLWQIATARFGQLRVVRRSGKTSLVVAEVRESAAKPGTFRKASATAQKKAAAGRASGLVTVVVFVIAKEAKQPRLLRGNTIRARALANAPHRMDTLFLKYFADVSSGPRRITNQRTGPAFLTGGWGD